ncbi:MAG TPA: hypothetical protein VEK08_25850, partial [Planctomycetota bacterium]|nr:hypothetical protein [Planctomycetota bacterium]
MSNPVSGEWFESEARKDRMTRRSWRAVTAFRYLVVESDKADMWQWLAAVAQQPLRITAIYTSGARSIHLLVRMDATSKEDWDAGAAGMKPHLIPLGADRKVFSAVRLTRLPYCFRDGTIDEVEHDGKKTHVYRRFPEPRLQDLLYLNPQPDGTPICEQGVL